VPLTALAKPEKRVALLCNLADTFIYVVSCIGHTGATGTNSSSLPQLLKRVNGYSNGVPAAVGFGVSTKAHFLSVADVVDGLVIGSQIITTIAEAPAGRGAKTVEEYCAEICGRRSSPGLPLMAKVDPDNAERSTKEPAGSILMGLHRRKRLTRLAVLQPQLLHPTQMKAQSRKSCPIVLASRRSVCSRVVDGLPVGTRRRLQQNKRRSFILERTPIILPMDGPT
jgi:hypothetical protein